MRPILYNCKLYTCKQRADCQMKDNPWKDGKVVCPVLDTYINQDQVKLREVPFSYIHFDVARVSDKIGVFESKVSDSLKLIFELYFLDHKSVKEISRMVNISARTIYAKIKNIKKQYTK